ncbi:MAG: hypothetical protein NVSMB26_18610 [Beijerinckiaceae bacterium]
MFSPRRLRNEARQHSFPGQACDRLGRRGGYVAILARRNSAGGRVAWHACPAIKNIPVRNHTVALSNIAYSGGVAETLQTLFRRKTMRLVTFAPGFVQAPLRQARSKTILSGLKVLLGVAFILGLTSTIFAA